MRKWIVLTVAVVLASGTLLAQRGQRDDRRRGEREQQTLSEAIDLSAEQRSEIDDIRRANRDEVREIFQTARENGEKLREEMRKENPDSAVVGRLMVATQAAGKEARAKQDELREKARAVLSEEQTAKLEDMEGDRASRRALEQARELGLIARPDRGGRSAADGPRRLPRAGRFRLPRAGRFRFPRAGVSRRARFRRPRRTSAGRGTGGNSSAAPAAAVRRLPRRSAGRSPGIPGAGRPPAGPAAAGVRLFAIRYPLQKGLPAAPASSPLRPGLDRSTS